MFASLPDRFGRLPGQSEVTLAVRFKVLKLPYCNGVKYEERLGGHGSASTVDGMLIYKIPNKRDRFFSLEELFERDILYESRDKEFIRKFLEAAQDGVNPMTTEACQIDWNEAAFHVILLDNTFMRAGYFLFRTCKNADYGTVFTMRDTSYRTKSLLPLIRAIDPVLHHDKR